MKTTKEEARLIQQAQLVLDFCCIIQYLSNLDFFFFFSDSIIEILIAGSRSYNRILQRALY